MDHKASHQSHIKNVLLAVRKVNQLMISEDDPQRLIEKACVSLTETMGYHNAWFIMTDRSGTGSSMSVVSGSDSASQDMRVRLEHGVFPECFQRCLTHRKLLVISDPSGQCSDCPLAGRYTEHAGMCCPLEYHGTFFGVIGVALPTAYAQDPEEQNIFKELADDLAFAMHQMEQTKVFRQTKEIIERSPAVAFVWENAEGWPVSFASENTECLFGWSAQDFVSGKTAYSSVIHPDDLVRVAEEVSRACADPAATEVEHADYRIVRKDGEIRWVEDMTSIRRTAEGRVTAFEGILLDVTKRHLLEEELFRSREQFMLAVEGSNDGIWDWDLRDNSLFLSARWKEILGYQDDELPHEFASFEDHLHPEDKPRVLDFVNQYLSGETRSYEIEFRMRHTDGTYRWILARGQAVRDKNGKPFRMAGSHTDITEQKRFEEELEETKRELEYIFHNSQIGIMLLRGGRVMARCNQRLADILGYDDPEAMVGMSMRNLHLSEERFREFGATHYEKLVDGEKFQVEYQLRRKDGTPVWCMLSGKALDTEDLNRGVIWVVDDLEARKRAEQELLETNRRLEEATARANEMAVQAEMANAAKSEFLANMSHEIRTPMNGVIGMTGLLLDTELAPEQQHFAETIRSSAETLLSLINDILDFSKIEAGKLDLENLDFDLHELLDELAEMMALKAHEKGLEFICAAEPETPTRLRGDPGRLRQILVNLAGNALKFTHQGEIAIQVELESETRTEAVLRFTVRDTGIGIPADNQSTLFDSFTQVDRSTTREYGGTGLGLAISKNLAEMMGGEIGVKSPSPTARPEEADHPPCQLSDQESASSDQPPGSTFWFTARFEKQQEREDSRLCPPPSLAGTHVLIVDDNATNRDILQRQLRSWRLRTETAADGASGLHRLREAAKRSDPFRIAVLDMQMPKMDGEDLGRVIKTDPLLNRTRLVLMTSLGNRGDTGRLRDIGFDARLIKPVRQSKLFNTLTNVLSSGSHDKTHRSPSTSRRFPQIANTQAKILLAEDNITNQQVALGMLKKMGLSAHPVGNGAEAIQALQHTTYDLVLMDVQMPVLDGLEATRTIRNWKVETGTGGTGNSKLESGTEDTTPETKSLNCSIPIIAMTAHAMQGDREKCLESGMDDYLAKPVDPQALLEVLRTWLPQEIREETTGGDAAEQDIDETLRAGLEPDAPASAPTDTDVVFDRSILMDRLQGDEALAATVIAAFLEDMPGQIASLREYVEQERVDQIVSQAHTIKGAAANLGAEALRKAALKMEKAAGEEAGSLETCLSVLERQFDRLHMELMQISSGCGRSQQEKGETHD